MLGKDENDGSFFSYVDLEAWVSRGHPLRATRDLTNAAPSEMSGKFEALYSERLDPRRLEPALRAFRPDEDPLARQQVGHAGAEDDAGMDEYLRSVLVRHDEAEPSRRVEELDGAGDLHGGESGDRRPAGPDSVDRRSMGLGPAGLEPRRRRSAILGRPLSPWTTAQVTAAPWASVSRPEACTDSHVAEHVPVPVLALQEAVALVGVEPLDDGPDLIRRHAPGPSGPAPDSPLAAGRGNGAGRGSAVEKSTVRILETSRPRTAITVSQETDAPGSRVARPTAARVDSRK